MRRLLLVIFLTAAGLVGPWAPPASACSCATYDVRERLPEVDGAGNVSDIAFCPSGGLLAEAFSEPNEQSYSNPGVAIRRVADLTVAWQRFLATGERPVSVSDVACRDDGPAAEVLAIVIEEDWSDTTVRHRARILVFGPEGEPRELWRGEATGGAFGPDGSSAYLSSGAGGRQLLHVDLADFARPVVRTLAPLPADAGPLAVSPDGRRLATATTFRSYTGAEPPPPIKAVVVDLAASPPAVIDAELASGTSTPYSALWAGTERVVFAPAWGGGPVRIFDTALNEVGSWSGWSASTSAVAGDHLVGLTGAMVLTAPLLTGPATQWADLESGVPGTVVAFPGGAAIGAPAEAGSPTTTTAPVSDEPTGEHAVVSLPGGSGGTGGRPALVGGAGVALLAAAVAGLIRRRRLPKLPPV